MFPKIGVKPTQIIHLFIGFSIIFTIHFGVPLFLETPILKPLSIMLGQQERHHTMTPPQESPSAVEVGGRVAKRTFLGSWSVGEKK